MVGKVNALSMVSAPLIHVLPLFKTTIASLVDDAFTPLPITNNLSEGLEAVGDSGLTLLLNKPMAVSPML